MKTVLLLCGKTTDKRISDLTDEYAERLSHYCDFSISVLPDIKNTKSMEIGQQKAKEGKQIISSLNDSDYLILLDERGRQPGSEEFASIMEGHMQRGTRRIVFAIGGPYGFSEEVYKRSSQLLSLSKMTFSHQMVRLIFIEQLYRAFTIIKGEPYHHK